MVMDRKGLVGEHDRSCLVDARNLTRPSAEEH
jgi:hypothetical protein